MKGRSFLTLLDYSPDEINKLLDLADQVKDEKKKGIFPKRLDNKNIVLIFGKLLGKQAAFKSLGEVLVCHKIISKICHLKLNAYF